MKKIRQKAILDLIRSHPVSSQEELLEGLQARKIDVSQSTLSRDIQELGLAKTGGVYAVMGGYVPPASEESLRRILREFLTSVETADNMVVVKTGTGNASAVAQAIDDAGWSEMVGSISGDNTIFIVTRSPKDGRRLEQRILEYSK